MTQGLQETELTLASMEAMAAARREYLAANLEALTALRRRLAGPAGYALDLLIDSIEPAQVTPPAPSAPIVFQAPDPYKPKARPARRPLYKWEETNPIVCDAPQATQARPARKAPKVAPVQEIDGIRLGDVIRVTGGTWTGKTGKVFEIKDGKVRFALPDHACTVSRADVELVSRPEKTECSADCRVCVMARLDKYGRAWCQNGQPYFGDTLIKTPAVVAEKCPNFKARVTVPVNETTGKPIGEFQEFNTRLHAPTDALLPKEDQYAEGRPWLPDFQTAGENSEQARLFDMEESVDKDPDAKLSKSWWLYLGRPNWSSGERKIRVGDTVRITAGPLTGQKAKVVSVFNGPPQQVQVQTPNETRTMGRADVEFVAKAFYGKLYRRPRASIDKYLAAKYGDREARRNAWRKRPA